MKLTPAERTSPAWRTIQTYYVERLASLRARNDMPKSAEDTAYLRGQIAEAKLILGLGEDDPSMPTEL